MRLLPPAFVKDRQLLSVMDTMENVSGLSLLLLNDTGSATQQWKITNVAPTGSAPQYKITPRSGEEYETDWCMSAGEGGYYTGNGAVVMQMPYSAERGLWSFSEVEMRILNLNVFYDESYDSKFVNASSRILTQLEELRMYYYDQFFIYVNYSTPQLFTSTADTCDQTNCACKENQAEGACLHPGKFEHNWGNLRDTNIHCHNFAYMTYSQVDVLKSAYAFYLQKAATVVFSGHEDTCMNDKIEEDNSEEEESEQHRIAKVVGALFPDINAFIVNVEAEDEDRINNVVLTTEEQASISVSAGQSMEQAIYEAKKEKLECLILMHEFGHLFNPGYNLDHYGGTDLRNEANSTDTFNKHCTYGEDNYANNQVLSPFTICEGCKNCIRSSRSHYHHIFMEVA